jgi:hypothetical protein
MPDKEKDSDRKIRELSRNIVNELLKTGEPLRVDISTGGAAAKCGSTFTSCSKYTCTKAFKCTATRFDCTGTFKDSKDYTLTLG